MEANEYSVRIIRCGKGHEKSTGRKYLKNTKSTVSRNTKNNILIQKCLPSFY